MKQSEKPVILRVAPEADLDRLIQQKVTEALAANHTAILEPWFRSPAVAAAIRRHQSVFHKRKFSLYFEKWGCLVCGTKRKPHENHALCRTCLERFRTRLMWMEKEYASTHPQEYADRQTEDLTSRVRSAERILGMTRPIDSEEK